MLVYDGYWHCQHGALSVRIANPRDANSLDTGAISVYEAYRPENCYMPMLGFLVSEVCFN